MTHDVHPAEGPHAATDDLTWRAEMALREGEKTMRSSAPRMKGKPGALPPFDSLSLSLSEEYFLAAGRLVVSHAPSDGERGRGVNHGEISSYTSPPQYESDPEYGEPGEREGVGDGIGDCLLYTSPSPRDQRGARMPSSA